MMADMSTETTPDSNNGSISKERPSTSKDRACPFCNQQFTSSSLGRHLDLYIKDKNPKPADGIHNVAEIRKIRGHITRRQPRTSMSKRESSDTPAGTPTTSGRSPSTATGFNRKHSPGVRDIEKDPDGVNFAGTMHTRINHPHWEATGVINNIPSMPRNGYSDNMWNTEGEEDTSRGHTDGKRFMNKQVLAKSTFNQKHKLMEANDTARAAELALRELYGSIRAANERHKPATAGPFDYDPLTLDFPALCLHCLPPPPTLYQTSPIPSPSTWSIDPPDHPQYESICLHFQKEFHRWRITSVLVDRRESLAPSASADFGAAIAQAEAEAHAQEEAISAHVNAAYSHWSNLSPATRVAHWRLELARSVGRKASALTQLTETNSFLAQENAHLRHQVDQLSRLQSPREFRMAQPQTVLINNDTISRINEMGLSGGGVGFVGIAEKKEEISVVASNAITRWKSVIQSGRTMTGQRALDDDSALEAAHTLPQTLSNEDDDGEGEHDADMDMDVEYIEMTNESAARAPEAPMRLVDNEAGYGSNSMNGGNTGLNGNLMGIGDFESVDEH